MAKVSPVVANPGALGNRSQSAEPSNVARPWLRSYKGRRVVIRTHSSLTSVKNGSASSPHGRRTLRFRLFIRHAFGPIGVTSCVAH